jgi:hypothetical protein
MCHPLRSGYATPQSGDECVLRFLIDERLNLDLVKVARGRSFPVHASTLRICWIQDR